MAGNSYCQFKEFLVSKLKKNYLQGEQLPD